MSRRRKRLKSTLYSGDAVVGGFAVESAVHTPRCQSSSQSQLRYDAFTVDTTMFESGSFASRSSIRLIHEVVSQFDRPKRDLVKSIGFGGLLHFPAIKKCNWKFAMWLMSCVDETASCINIGQHISISFNKYDIGHVFGIPSSGKSVIDVRADSRMAKDKVIQSYLGLPFRDQRSIKMVQEIIQRDYEHPMSEHDAGCFRVAFVVFVVSNLLYPSAKYDYASIDYWNALQDPMDISSYDWCEYVIRRLLEAVSKFKYDISSNIKFPNISGCSIFLQVLYLDSLELEGLTLVHDSLPRVRNFSFDIMRSMISADKNYYRHMKCDASLPIGKLRDHGGCIYSWASLVNEPSEDRKSSSVLAVWEATVGMVNLLNIPMEQAAGPLFVAAADFQEQINEGLVVNGLHAIKFMSVLVSLMTPYVRGFRYQFSLCRCQLKSGSVGTCSSSANGIRLLSLPLCSKDVMSSGFIHCKDPKCKLPAAITLSESRCFINGSSSSRKKSAMFVESSIGDHLQREMSSIIQTFHDTPPCLNVSQRVVTVMSQFYSLMRKTKLVNDFDLNSCPSGDNSSSCSSPISSGSHSGETQSPWELGPVLRLHGVDFESLFGKLRSLESDTSYAIIRRSPKYIQVSSCDLVAQFLGRCEMELDLFDALIRCARQDDELLYGSLGSSRWRYLFESDFMVHILSGSLDLLDPNICDHLSISSLTVDVSKCKMVFFPALLQFQWVCFAWSPDENVIYMFEPSYSYSESEMRVQAIERASYLLKLALKTLCASVFSGICTDVSMADVRLLNIDGPSNSRFNRSGVLCSLFYRCYDGVQLRPNFLEEDDDLLAANLLLEALKLKDNSGTISSFL